jgi:sulfite reductase beta subunit-like hemoprotein
MGCATPPANQLSVQTELLEPPPFLIHLHTPAHAPPHTNSGPQINDLAFEAVRDPASGALMFNVLVGGYFSIKRNIMSVPLGVAVTADQVVPFTVAALRVFRWARGEGGSLRNGV